MSKRIGEQWCVTFDPLLALGLLVVARGAQTLQKSRWLKQPLNVTAIHVTASRDVIYLQFGRFAFALLAVSPPTLGTPIHHELSRF